MDSLAAFLDMDGYGAFVWPSFAITVLVLGGLLVASVRFLRSREGALTALEGGDGEARGAEDSSGEAQA